MRCRNEALSASRTGPRETGLACRGFWYGGEDGFSLVWPGDLDVGADQIYEMALEQNGRTDAAAFIRWRWRNKLSLSEAADALGLSRRMVAYYESGEQEVPRTVLLALKGWEAERKHSVA
jgi:hypothetical protein